MGPLRRLLWRREVPRPPLGGRFSPYAVPVGLLALIGLGFAAAEYLEDYRAVPGAAIGALAAGSVLPAAVAYRYPVLGWRIAFVMMFLGSINVNPRESWPWNPVQIVLFLIVLARLAVTQDSAVTAPQPGLGDLRGLVETARDAGGPKILILTTFDLDDYVYEALRSGASGFLLKDAPAADLINAVRVVAAGEALLAPSVTRKLIAEFAGRAHRDRPKPAALNALTPRETDVLRLIARGRSNQEIAGELVVAEQTVKTHIGRILAKLNLRDRAQAVVFAYETGLVTPG